MFKLVENVIAELTEKELGLSWLKNRHTGVYYLNYQSHHQIARCWRQGNGGYGSLSGQSFHLLKDAKEDTLNQVKLRLFGIIHGISKQLPCVEQDTKKMLQPFWMNAFELVYKKVIGALAELKVGGAGFLARHADNRYANAVCAFDLDGQMFSLTPIYSYSTESTLIKGLSLSSLALRVSCSDIHRGFQSNSKFGCDGCQVIKLSGLDDGSLEQVINAVITLADQFNSANAA